MKALVLNGDFDISVQDRPDPRPAAGEVLIAVIATGICGSDFHGYSGENGRRHPGQVMGHETVGRVAGTAPDVTGLQVGDLVTVNPVMSCGDCEVCRAGRQHWCARKKVLGVDPEISAGFAEKLVVPAQNVVGLPAELPAELGALVEPLSVGYHAALRGGCRPDDRVLVIGGGPIGQACLLAARRIGVRRPAVSDPRRSRRELCRRLGATVLDPGAGAPLDAVTTALGGRPTLVLDAVGLSTTLADALEVATLGARIVLVGMGAPQIGLSAYAISTEERSVIGAFTYTAAEFAATAEWVGTRPAGIEQLIDGRVGWADAPRSFDELARGVSEASKVLVFPHGPPLVAARPRSGR